MLLLVSGLLAFGGVATDIAYQVAVKAELQRSLDAAALAGAGNLAFDSTAFDAVRASARQYAALNPVRHPVDGTVTLDLNAGNAANGDIVVGTWSRGSFTPWSSGGSDPSGRRVNAVQCRWSGQVPTTFLRLLGITTLPVAATARGLSNPPTSMNCGEPFLPVAVTQCSFVDITGAFSSQGCGAALTFTNSNDNTAAWVSLDGSNPNASYLRSAIAAAANPGGACGSFLKSGDFTQTNNGMMNSVFGDFADAFIARRVSILAEDICPASGCNESTPPTYPKEGGGWEVVVPMIQTSCPPGAISGQHQILSFTRFVVTQVFNKQDGCLVWPNPDPQAQAYCANADGTRRRDNDLRAIFGYFRCDRLGAVASQDDLPRAALARNARLVQ